MWKVSRLSKNQLLDVRPEDVLYDGWFRLCETYRGGGGYDQFPLVAKSRFGYPHHKQFIVQLYGCNLDCPYCYVTREGVWGEFGTFRTEELIEHFINAFKKHRTSVFHLMGGAPALQMKQWPNLIRRLTLKCREEKISNWVFHSDLLLTERSYDPKILKQIRHYHALYAVDIKGLTHDEYKKNTRKEFPEELFYENLCKLEECNIPYYLTFTNIEHENKLRFFDHITKHFPEVADKRIKESFSIGLINYKATKYVDSRHWGGVK